MNKIALQLKINPAELSRGSVLVLILANLVPLYGVLFLDWETFPILLLFWMENVVVGVINVLKMLLASPGKLVKWGAKLFMIPFFCVHYGMFTLVHGVFVFAIFGRSIEDGGFFPSTNTLFQVIHEYSLQWAVLALVLSHVVSLIVNYIGKGEYKTTDVNQLMMQPYGRVVILHVTILFGGSVLLILGSPLIGLVLLLVLKIYVDVLAHLRQHKTPVGTPEVTPAKNI